MRYVITYVNITKEKCYCYVTVILNIGIVINMTLPLIFSSKLWSQVIIEYSPISQVT